MTSLLLMTSDYDFVHVKFFCKMYMPFLLKHAFEIQKMIIILKVVVILSVAKQLPIGPKSSKSHFEMLRFSIKPIQTILTHLTFLNRLIIQRLVLIFCTIHSELVPTWTIFFRGNVSNGCLIIENEKTLRKFFKNN